MKSRNELYAISQITVHDILMNSNTAINSITSLSECFNQAEGIYSYFAYGLAIHSVLPLPELVASKARADVVIQLGKLDYARSDHPVEHCCWTAGEEIYLLWKEVGTFLIRGGREIIIDPVPGVEEPRLRLFLLGAAMAVLLHQRGLLTLHASAVALNGEAVAFLGGKGWGKSTMAATLYARGHSPISDDVIALKVNRTSSPTVFPAFPQLKLWPDAIASLGDDPETLPRLSSQFEKRHRQVDSGFLQKPLPLRRIYILGKGLSPEIEPLQAQEAMIQLNVNSYCTRFGNQLLQGEAASSHFLQCAELCQNVPIYRLKRPTSLALLPVVAQLVEEHLDSAQQVYAAQ